MAALADDITTAGRWASAAHAELGLARQAVDVTKADAGPQRLKAAGLVSSAEVMLERALAEVRAVRGKLARVPADLGI